ncbi:DHHA1 domain-containing protein, partial [Ruminococcaceae bacterium OttesenSCG-928-L11]|nr:DHHA1 domain-containing protein [Ruminococcaceae bacterium OttesenSCG-928-L11]
EEEFPDVKVIGAQVADELMTINGVQASFVVSSLNQVVNASARSMGEVNVQVIMESLGGGGHHTMAAAQFPDVSVQDVRKQVVEAIDAYYEALNAPPEKVEPGPAGEALAEMEKAEE